MNGLFPFLHIGARQPVRFTSVCIELTLFPTWSRTQLTIDRQDCLILCIKTSDRLCRYRHTCILHQCSQNLKQNFRLFNKPLNLNSIPTINWSTASTESTIYSSREASKYRFLVRTQQQGDSCSLEKTFLQFVSVQ